MRIFFDAEVLAAAWPGICSGIGVTLGLALTSIAAGVALGLVLATVRALLRGAPLRPVGGLIAAYADVFRAMPPLVLLVVLYFAAPFAGIELSGFMAAFVALGLVLGASAEEIFWAGITSVNRGQWEAALSTGLSRGEAFRRVVLPQAVRLTIPPLTNRAIATGKNTALASVVAVPEVLNQAASVQAQTASPAPLLLAAGVYVALFLPLVRIGRWLETRFHIR
ncbi:MAG: amino acid ABC transporter permease [Acidobacteriota bacterium]|nr:amino acid ABC transporter permease [Acidobacteriota bacterium]MDE3260587.1 amino acid ABC transporter permease [Acidobacteriota bacterium]